MSYNKHNREKLGNKRLSPVMLFLPVKSLAKYGSDGFVILDFPCSQFGNQAPGSNEEIVSFCDSRYGITFPIFSKIEVNGDSENPLYTFLKSQKGFAGFDPEHPLTPMLESVLGRIAPDYL